MSHTTTARSQAPKLLRFFRETAVPKLMKSRGYENIHQVPRLLKVVINMGVKEGAEDIKILDQVTDELARITGQKPVITRAKKSIAAFHLKEGAPIGLKVTLRKSRMYEFMERLIGIAMPRIRDFRGVPLSSFDQGGNYTFGIREQTIFPEVDFEKIKKVQGMDVTLVTSASSKEEAKELLELIGIPFQKPSQRSARS